MKNYLKLMRVRHYLKNILVFMPLLFSGQLTNINKLIITLIGFVSFSLIASIIYIFNDIMDIEKDKVHPEKKNRPIASGEIKQSSAFLFMIVLFGIAVFLNIIMHCNTEIALKNFALSIVLQGLYLLLNIGYSLGLKQIPFLDILILVSGFIIRLLYGAVISNIAISNWLYLTVGAGSFYMGLGKRRNEIIKQGYISREVLKKYNRNILNTFMNIFLILTMIFYCLWSIKAKMIDNTTRSYFLPTIPLFILILLKYNLDIQGDSFGDPIDVIFKDKKLIILMLAFGIIMLGLLYFL